MPRLSPWLCVPPLPRVLFASCRCVSYPALLDSLHLRLHRMREVLRKHLGAGEDVQVGAERIRGPGMLQPGRDLNENLCLSMLTMSRPL